MMTPEAIAPVQIRYVPPGLADQNENRLASAPPTIKKTPQMIRASCFGPSMRSLSRARSSRSQRSSSVRGGGADAPLVDAPQLGQVSSDLGKTTPVHAGQV